MPPEDRDRALIQDMLDSARAVVDMCAGLTYEVFCSDRKTRRAIEREIEIVGEAARFISKPFQNEHSEIPWNRIAATRHRLAHEYGSIQNEILFRIAPFHVPELIRSLENLRAEDAGGENPQA